MFGLILSGFLWGVTNPFLKRGTAGVEEVQEKHFLKQRISEILFLITKWEVKFIFCAISDENYLILSKELK